MLVSGYFENYMSGDLERVIYADIEADKETIENCMYIANDLYMEYEDNLDEYCRDFPMGIDKFMSDFENTDFERYSPYVEYLWFVLDEFGIEWSTHKVDCDLEVLIN